MPMRKQKKTVRKRVRKDDHLLTFGAGVVFALGVSASIMGQIVPALFMAAAVLVTLLYVESTDSQKRGK